MIFVFTKMTSVQTQNDGWHGLKKKGMGMFLGLADVPLTRPLQSSAMSWRKVSHFSQAKFRQKVPCSPIRKIAASEPRGLASRGHGSHH